jgi:hypothetical protein
VQRRRPLEDAHELLGVGRGQVGGGERLDAEPVGQQARRAEGALHRELLVEQHPDQQRERVTARAARRRRRPGRCGAAARRQMVPLSCPVRLVAGASDGRIDAH